MAKRWNTSKPIRMWIDGHCFNIKPYDKFKKYAERAAALKDSEQSLQPLEHNFIITPTDDQKLATQFRLPFRYYKCLNNFYKFSIKRLGEETQTEISIPDSEMASNLTISGKSESDIINAREVIHSIVGEIREKEFVQQFFAIPVNSDEVRKSFEQFKEEILNGDTIQGMDASIFQSAAKLHLTIAVFSLLDDLEKNEAIAALNDCKSQIIEPIIKDAKHPLKIKVAGIECMNDNISKVNVLYANAKIEHEKDDNLLQNMANSISSFFYDRGLVRQYQDNVKLHVTLLNTKYRKVPTHANQDNSDISPKKHSKWYIKKQPFDARSIIEKYKDYCFGEAVLDSIHLCYVSSVGEDGFYTPLSVVAL